MSDDEGTAAVKYKHYKTTTSTTSAAIEAVGIPTTGTKRKKPPTTTTSTDDDYKDPDYTPGDEAIIKELNVIQSIPRPKRRKTKVRSTETNNWVVPEDDDITQFDEEEESKQIAEHKTDEVPEEKKEEFPTCNCELETEDGKPSDQKAPATLNTVKKEGPTQGQQFWGCSNPNWRERCKFFLWDSEFQSGDYKRYNKAILKPIDVKKTHRKKEVCLCGEKAVAKRSTTPSNPNRVFWSCPTRACTFFRWDDT